MLFGPQSRSLKACDLKRSGTSQRGPEEAQFCPDDLKLAYALQRLLQEKGFLVHQEEELTNSNAALVSRFSGFPSLLVPK